MRNLLHELKTNILKLLQRGFFSKNKKKQKKSQGHSIFCNWQVISKSLAVF